ncbi:sigma54-dependent transcription regulator [Schumannella luteola]|uniref:Sigma54-dependent transcription regulator n=1 Tax=Schumannella luteola TaxID=472059 RepID=A0A852Y627_9MICO|nr:sigma54-dependent transcription regulator [Schumannella luteola]
MTGSPLFLGPPVVGVGVDSSTRFDVLSTTNMLGFEKKWTHYQPELGFSHVEFSTRTHRFTLQQHAGNIGPVTTTAAEWPNQFREVSATIARTKSS